MSPARGVAIAFLAALVASAAGGAVSAADQAGARVSVEFVDPEKFTDIKASAARPEKGSAAILAEIARFLETTGVAQIPAGFTLEIRVTDIDLAGEFEPVRPPRFEHTRIMRDVYSPRVDLGFRLKDAQGRVVKEGQRTLRDLNYLSRSLLVSDDSLRYDKALLRDWLRREFAW